MSGGPERVDQYADSRPFVPVRSCLLSLLLISAIPASMGYGSEVRIGFDEPKTSWLLSYPMDAAKLIKHQRSAKVKAKGERSESIQMQIAKPRVEIYCLLKIPPVRALDSFRVSMSCLCNQSRVQLAVRVVFPHAVDPSTGTTLTTRLKGSFSTKVGEWNQLTCTTTSRQIRDQLFLLRKRLNRPQLTDRDAYIDRIYLGCNAQQGKLHLFLDELVMSPVVPANEKAKLVNFEQEEQLDSRVDFRLDRLKVDQRPFFPRFVRWHQEEPHMLKELGMNVVKIPDYRDQDLMKRLQSVGLNCMASPPKALTRQQDVLQEDEASLLPFSKETDPILFWYTGTLVSSSQKEEFLSWIKQIRNADHYANRPILADVSGEERLYSRYLSMMGVSRHLLHSDFSFERYQQWLQRKRKLARPGAFTWTWIQVEADPRLNLQRKQMGKRSLFVEPEQIRLQVYSALCAGFLGIGYWTNQSLEGTEAGKAETRAILSQLNLELGLLEPFLATGTLRAPIALHVKVPPTAKQEHVRPLGVFQNSPETTDSQNPRTASLSSRIDPFLNSEGDSPAKAESHYKAAQIQSEYGTLILPVIPGKDSQFVPEAFPHAKVELIIPGVPESSTAWEITPTRFRNLPGKWVAGGLQLELDQFDQTAAILVCSSTKVQQELKQQIPKIAAKSAHYERILASEKLKRVRTIDHELRSLGYGHGEAFALIEQAEHFLNASQRALDFQDFHSSRLYARSATRALRTLQTHYWKEAVQKLSSPISSPYTICFQSLPDHWKLLRRLNSQPERENLLRSGDFEDVDTMIAEKWEHQQSNIPGLFAHADLYPAGRHGSYSLRLEAIPAPGAKLPQVINQSPIKVITPEMSVHAGQIVSVSGWVKVVEPGRGNLEGAILYDNIGGMVTGLRWFEKCDWKPFHFVREVSTSGPFRLTMALNGMGAIQFDHLKVMVTGSQLPPIIPESVPETSLQTTP